MTTVSKTLRPELSPQVQHGRRKPTPTSCSLASTQRTHIHTHRKEKNQKEENAISWALPRPSEQEALMCNL